MISSPESGPVDSDNLPPTQHLILELLAARHRSGETEWTLHTRFRRHIEALERLGLISTRAHGQPKSIYAKLTDAGRAAAMSDDWPGIRVVAVVNWRRERVHGITADQDQATRWTQEIVARYGGDNLAATQCVDLVRPGGRR